MYTGEAALNYRCPRWGDLPNIGLYMDQVTSVLGEYVFLFYPADQQKPVTPTMINNYVKQKIIMPSKNKKYNREHLARLYILFLLKPVLSLGEICEGISFMSKDQSIAQNYDLFCDEIEAAMAKAFGGGEDKRQQLAEGDEIIRTIALAFSYTMRAKFCLSDNKPTVEAEKPVKTEKAEKPDKK